MRAGGTITATAGVMVTVQARRFAWLKAESFGLANWVDRIERGVAFVRGRLFLALPARPGQPGSDPYP